MITILLNEKQIKKLEENDIEFVYYDTYDLFNKNSVQVKNDKFEIEFYDQTELNKAKKILNI